MTLHVVLQNLEWSDVSLLPNVSYDHVLWLNDSDDSQLGPGIFLDRSVGTFSRKPTYPPVTNFESWTLLRRRSIPNYEKNFGIRVNSMQEITANETYFVNWASPPGDALHDNGNIMMHQNGFDWKSCSLFDQANEAEWWGLTLPGRRRFLQEEYARCDAAEMYYVPVVNWLGSFFEED